MFLLASQKKKIVGLLDHENIWIVSIDGITKIISECFLQLFSSSCLSSMQLEDVLSYLQPKETVEMNTSLMVEFISDKVKCALMQMHPIKAIGLDGLFLTFFQDHWNIVGRQLVNTCLKILNKGVRISNLNHIVVVLVPKVKNPKKRTKFSPINL